MAQDGAGRNGHAPTVEGVMELLKKGKEYYSGFHAACLEEDNFYLGKVAIPKPTGEPVDEVHPATATAIVNVATDHLDVNNISIEVPASGKARQRAERLKRFYLGTWLSVKGPVLRTAARHGFQYGIAATKSMFATDQWPDPPMLDDFPDEASYRTALEEVLEERGHVFPLVVRNVNPKNLVWDDSRIRPRWAIEFYQRRPEEVAWRYPEFQKSGSSPFVDWVEYWDEEWALYLADGQAVWGPERHSYGHLCYTFAHPASSLDWDDGPPHERYRGILRPVHSLLKEEARLITAYSAILRMYAYRTIDFYGPRSAAEETARAYELFGAKNVVPPGVSIQASPLVTPPPEILRQLSMVQTMIEEATFPNVVRGLRPTGAGSGFAISVLAGMGRLVFQGMADGLARAMEQVNTKFAQLVENKARGRVTVHGRAQAHSFDQTIGPEDIQGYYENHVELKAEAPEEREREALLALKLWNSGQGIISMYEAQRRAGVANPLEEQMTMAAERLLRSPLVQAKQDEMAAERLGLLEQLAQAAGAREEGGRLGSRNLGGSALQRPGERSMQQARLAARAGVPSVFPTSLGGIDLLGRRLGTARGGAQGMPSGQRVA